MGYTRQSFVDGMTLQANHLNNIEQGIVQLEEQLEDFERDLEDVAEDINKKQDVLIDGFNIKTVNGQSLLGSGNIEVAVESPKVVIDSALNSTSENPVQNKVVNSALQAVNSAVATKQDALVSGTTIKTINGQSLLGSGDVAIGSNSASVVNQQELKILFVGNSLTQDAVSYLPLLLDEVTPEIKYTIYNWYNGGHTLAQQYQKFVAKTPCENFGTITNNQAGGWDLKKNTVTMDWVCQNCDFDIVVIQEYSYYDFTDSVEIDNFNNVVGYICANYNKPFKVYTFIDAPMRTRIQSDYAKAKKYAKLHMTKSVAQGLVNPGSVVVYGIEHSDLKSLGDKGQLSPDGTHTQEGLPCLIQSYVLALWVFEWLGIPKSILNSRVRMTSSLYSTWQSMGPNLGSGVVQGTEYQHSVAQQLAIKAFKYGQYLTNSYINLMLEDSDVPIVPPSGGDNGDGGDSGGSSGGSSSNPNDNVGGGTTGVDNGVFVKDAFLSASCAVGSTYVTTSNKYSTDYDVYKVTARPNTTYTISTSHGLYISANVHLPAIVICNDDGIIVDIIRAQQNTQTVHEEVFEIDTSKYENIGYILVSVHKSAFSVTDNNAEAVSTISVVSAGSIFATSSITVGSKYRCISSPYTTSYSVYQTPVANDSKYMLTIKHGIYSAEGVNMHIIIICDSDDTIVNVVTSPVNVSKERTETFNIDMTQYNDAEYHLVFVSLEDQFSIVKTVW